jgi:hypothetical protein
MFEVAIAVGDAGSIMGVTGVPHRVDEHTPRA